MAGSRLMDDVVVSSKALWHAVATADRSIRRDAMSWSRLSTASSTLSVCCAFAGFSLCDALLGRELHVLLDFDLDRVAERDRVVSLMTSASQHHEQFEAVILHGSTVCVPS